MLKVLELFSGIGEPNRLNDGKELSSGGGLGGCSSLYMVNEPIIVASRGRYTDKDDTTKTEQQLEVNDTGLTNTITTVQKDNYVAEPISNYKIRKLTPRECYRLMGWKDEQFDKIHGISDAQLYKTAGNGIVVNVLEAIFEKMFK